MISKTMQTILHALSYGNIEVEASRRLADIKRLDAMRIFVKKLDTKVYNGTYEVPVRLYFPSEEAISGKPVEGEKYPVLLFFHGGGWVTESVENYDRVCSRMAQSTGHIVMSVEYRLAPEYRFPVPLEDCYAAAKALYMGHLVLPADPDRITIIGDSAGGNLAAAVCLKARDTGDFAPKKQILIYPAQYYYLELNTARMLRELDIFCPEDEKIVERRIVQIEKETGTVLDEMQKKAVQEAAGHGLLILTGGPGTGKTTTINAIIRYFEGEGAEIRLAAPTGRAAKRMTEATGYEAQTIHRLLELSGMPEDDREGQPIHFERNAENPLETDVIIIDEMSMVDIHLIHSLLMAVTAGTRLILVGDENQLPSVGPGNVLRDIIRSGQFPVVELKKIFRQASESDIVVNAHKINKGEQVEINNKSRDFFFLKRYDADIIIRVVIA